MLKFIRNIILLAIAAAVILPWWVVLEDRLSAGTYRDYLRGQMQTVELEADGGGLNFDPDFYENRLFIVGEIHGTQTAQLVDLRMMQHLNQRIGLRHIMAEMDVTQADRINAYLASGDESLIRPIFETWLAASAQWGNRQHFEKLQALYAYNSALPADRKLVYFGVDQIQDRDNALDWFGQRLAAHPAGPDSPIGVLRTALLAGERNEPTLTGLLDAAHDDIEETGDPMLAYMADAIRADFDDPGRYERVEANIRTMVEAFGIGDDEPVYGFWGLFHSLGVPVNGGARPLVMRIRESDLPFADGVVNLTMSYADSSQNMPSHMLPGPLQPDGPFFDGPVSQDNPYLAYLDGIGDLKAVSGGADATIFRLSADGSPYENGGRLIDQTGLLTYVFRFEIDDFEGFATDYTILIQGSPALTPYEG